MNDVVVRIRTVWHLNEFAGFLLASSICFLCLTATVVMTTYMACMETHVSRNMITQVREEQRGTTCGYAQTASQGNFTKENSRYIIERCRKGGSYCEKSKILRSGSI